MSKNKKNLVDKKMATNDQQIFGRMSNGQLVNGYNVKSSSSSTTSSETTLFENIFIIGSYLLLITTFPISLLMCFKVTFVCFNFLSKD